MELPLIVSTSKDVLPHLLTAEIVRTWRLVTQTRSSFTVALSGGSLPSFLVEIQSAFANQGIDDPKFEQWYVFLADERCVCSRDPDSNLGALQKHLFSKVPIPAHQIYGINESLLDDIPALTDEYESVVRKVLAERSEGKLDLAVLGFGPDGHTCSLFPGHKLLHEKSRWISFLTDSPKPPPSRITMTLPLINYATRFTIICGAGSSKLDVVQSTFTTKEKQVDLQGGLFTGLEFPLLHLTHVLWSLRK